MAATTFCHPVPAAWGPPGRRLCATAGAYHAKPARGNWVCVSPKTTVQQGARARWLARLNTTSALPKDAAARAPHYGAKEVAPIAESDLHLLAAHVHGNVYGAERAAHQSHAHAPHGAAEDELRDDERLADLLVRQMPQERHPPLHPALAAELLPQHLDEDVHVERPLREDAQVGQGLDDPGLEAVEVSPQCLQRLPVRDLPLVRRLHDADDRVLHLLHGRVALLCAEGLSDPRQPQDETQTGQILQQERCLAQPHAYRAPAGDGHRVVDHRRDGETDEAAEEAPAQRRQEAPPHLPEVEGSQLVHRRDDVHPESAREVPAEAPGDHAERRRAADGHERRRVAEEYRSGIGKFASLWYAALHTGQTWAARKEP
eukprot:CAMPEP_0176189858 /NCGR_PEP_ID=MMETSP0121_2-20121125/3645_1 /TAXON_ID=160619 /ORGANISM="Kryptoperidinium foliaceum, Strain CCMP 1326" /LENGTH=372 /DNA_ID=CAMNT_0017528473 /DNA_START=51 /DNA_END=1168 /DNA_ORIENTATION=-